MIDGSLAGAELAERELALDQQRDAMHDTEFDPIDAVGYNVFLIQPASQAQEQFAHMNKDLVLGYLNSQELQEARDRMSTFFIMNRYPCLKQASNLLLHESLALLNISRSKNGFATKAAKTNIKEMNFKDESPRRGILNRFF